MADVNDASMDAVRLPRLRCLHCRQCSLCATQCHLVLLLLRRGFILCVCDVCEQATSRHFLTTHACSTAGQPRPSSRSASSARQQTQRLPTQAAAWAALVVVLALVVLAVEVLLLLRL